MAEVVMEAAAEAAETKPAKKKAAADPGEELVTVQLFKDNERYKDDVFVAVNGERCQIQRGVPVQIKRKFAQVLEQSAAQDQATAALIQRESASYRAKARELNI